MTPSPIQPQLQPSSRNAPTWSVEFRDCHGTTWKSEAALAAGDTMILFVNDDDDNGDGFADHSAPVPVEGENDLGAIRLLGLPSDACVSLDVIEGADKVRWFCRPNREQPVQLRSWVSPDVMYREASLPMFFVEGLRVSEFVNDVQLEVRVRDGRGAITSKRLRH